MYLWMDEAHYQAVRAWLTANTVNKLTEETLRE